MERWVYPNQGARVNQSLLNLPKHRQTVLESAHLYTTRRMK